MLNPSFTRGEYWLLEAVTEHALPIFLLDSPGLEVSLNKPGHGMLRSVLIDTMRQLFGQRLIVAHRFGDFDDCFELSPDQIETALDEQDIKEAHCYRLTEVGGSHWEAFARPDWDWYISTEYTPRDDEIWTAELLCAQRDYLEAYLRMLRLNEYDVDEGSLQADTLTPWNATYWKTLPLGHRISFRCTQKEHVHSVDRLWYDARWYRWR